MSDIALQINLTEGVSVTSGNPVIFNNVIYSSGDIVYNSVTGVITFNEVGRYIINWQVVTHASAAISGPIFGLSSSQGDSLASDSPVSAGMITGTGIIEVVAAPVTAMLLNLSGQVVFYPPNLPVIANLAVVQDDIVGVGSTGATGPMGPTGATGSTGPEAGSTLMEAGLIAGEELVIEDADPVLFDTIRLQAGSITYNPVSGIFTISETGYYLVNWWVGTDGAGEAITITFALQVNGSSVSNASTPIVAGQIGGTALILVTAAPTTLSLNNDTGETVFIASTPTKAGITITRVGPST